MAVAGVAWLAVLGVAGAYVYLSPALPTSSAMQHVEMNVPLRVYTRSGQLISQIGEKRMIPITFEDIPPLVRNAVLAAEDDRFFSHHGVDWQGVLRAVIKNLSTASDAQGGSTITMQAARNMFLTLDKTARRKLSEVFVTFRMERDFTKEQILATYLNVIFFGQRSYGIAAAAETFYGKRLEDLSVGQAATLAGIIQLPSRYNPVTSPQLAQVRRNYVLRRMTELGYIDAATADKARSESTATRGFAPLSDVEAPYTAELARQDLINRFGPAAVNSGYKVFTTLDGRLQTAANRAVRLGLIEYDRRHGYRGPIAHVNLPAGSLGPAKLDALIGANSSVAMLQVAMVTRVDAQAVQVYIRGQGDARIEWDGLSWARSVKNERLGAMPKKAADVLSPGDIVHVVSDRHGVALLAQLPLVQGALVALDPQDGAIASMVGGFDFYTNSFNRVTQAKRQPGSGFKPFLYSAALEHGFTPSTMILDAPIVQDDPNLEGAWRPENSNKEFRGPVRLREGLYRSLNMVSIRILRDIGLDAAIDHAQRFGFDKAALPENQTLALGTMSATPLQMVTGYATFANGGYHVDPYLIDRIENAAGEVVFAASPKIVCPECERDAAAPASIERRRRRRRAAPRPKAAPAAPALGPTAGEADALARLRATIDKRNDGVPAKLASLAAVQGGRGYLPLDRVAPRVLSAANAWLMDDLMSDVVQRGTGVRARALGRMDLAGKTGTSDEGRDAWFNGFNSRLVASAWVGFDEERSLGRGEEGSSVGVPIWVHFMREALRGMPEEVRPMPPGVIRLRVSARTGAMTSESTRTPSAKRFSSIICRRPRHRGSPAARGKASAVPAIRSSRGSTCRKASRPRRSPAQRHRAGGSAPDGRARHPRLPDRQAQGGRALRRLRCVRAAQEHRGGRGAARAPSPFRRLAARPHPHAAARGRRRRDGAARRLPAAARRPGADGLGHRARRHPAARVRRYRRSGLHPADGPPRAARGGRTPREDAGGPDDRRARPAIRGEPPPGRGARVPARRYPPGTREPGGRPADAPCRPRRGAPPARRGADRRVGAGVAAAVPHSR